MTWAGAIASPTPGMAILHGYWFHFRLCLPRTSYAPLSNGTTRFDGTSARVHRCALCRGASLIRRLLRVLEKHVESLTNTIHHIVGDVVCSDFLRP